LDLETGRFAALPYAQEETDFSDSIQDYTDEFHVLAFHATPINAVATRTRKMHQLIIAISGSFDVILDEVSA